MLAHYLVLLHGSLGLFDEAGYVLAAVTALLAIACFGAEAVQRRRER